MCVLRTVWRFLSAHAQHGLLLAADVVVVKGVVVDVVVVAAAALPPHMAWLCVCVCVCVVEREGRKGGPPNFTSLSLITHMLLKQVVVCVCGFLQRERDRIKTEKEGDGGR